MKYINNKQINIIFKIIFFLISIVITVLMIPDSNKFKYEFQKGEPWKHESLIAEYDFPVFKSEAAMENERDSILKDFKPYFKYDKIVFKNISEGLMSDLLIFETEIKTNLSNEVSEKDLQAFIDSTKNIISESLNSIYNKGIIENVPDNEFNSIDQLRIYLLRDNIAELSLYTDFYTQKEAYNAVNEIYGKYRDRNLLPVPSFEFSKYISYNVKYDLDMTFKVKNQLLEEISPVRGLIQAGEGIISKGQLINDYKYQVLKSLEKEYLSEGNSYSDKALLFLGQFILAASIFGILFFYLYFYNKEIFKNNRKVLYFLTLSILFIVAVAAVSKQKILDVYIVPIAILPLITATFYKPRTAVLHHIITILLIGFIAANSFEYVFIQFVVGFVAISGVSKLNRRSQIIWTTLFIFLTYFLIYSAISIIHEGKYNLIDLTQITWFAIGSVLVLLAYPLIYIFEKAFGFISDVTLIELSDTNRPLLKLLAEKAPGTFQHSVQVANISEEAARELNANPLLVRAGALYHDIGKMNNPLYFIENQHNDNPHEKIDPLQSAEIIKKHVDDGIKIAKKYNLPKEIIEFIPSHHGKSKIYWFLYKYKEYKNKEEVNEEQFIYNGELPRSKETAIVMIVDSVEAASRTLKEYSEESIDQLIENIVNNKISDNLLINADITLAEISKVKEVLKNKLKNIYHTRVEYPKIK